MAGSCILLRALTATSLALSIHTTAFAQANSIDLKGEAINALSQIDCQVEQLRPEIQALKSAVQNNIRRMNEIVRENRAIADEAEKQAIKNLNEFAMEPVEDYLKDAAIDGAADGAVKIAGRLFGKSFKKLTFAFATKFQGAVGELGLLNDIIGKEREILELFATSMKLGHANRTIIAISNDMSENTRAFDAASNALASLLKYRETTIDQWSSRGVVVDEELLGSACHALTGSFDGVWAVGESPDADHVEIRGDKFRYVSIGMSNVVAYCGKPVGSLTSRSTDHAVGSFKTTCAEGSSFVGALELQANGNGVTGKLCLRVSGGGDMAVPECPNAPTSFLRLSQ